MVRNVPIQMLYGALANHFADSGRTILDTRAVAAFAREKLAEVEAKQGKFPVTKYVNGQQGLSEEHIELGKKIEYFIHIQNKFLKEMKEEIEKLSPYTEKERSRKGYRNLHFRMSWVVLRNGEIYDDFLENATVREGDQWIIVNVMPYVRYLIGNYRRLRAKIRDAGKLGHKGKAKRRVATAIHPKGLSIQSNDGWLELLVSRWNRRNKDVAEIRFIYFTPSPQVTSSALGTPVPRGATKGNVGLKDLRYPAVEITVPTSMWTRG